MAAHLLRDDNDHVEVHELRGFVARDLLGALDEVYATSRGTRCRQYLYSVSLNPPVGANVETSDFIAALGQIEDALGLHGQARATVFHVKNGRRHLHAVWSRIRLPDMKAIHLPYNHRRLMRVATRLFEQHQWEMPRGLRKLGEGDELNFTHSEFQQSNRAEKDPKAIKASLREAWEISDCSASLSRALNERGYCLCRGDRRGYVVVDASQEVYSLPRWLGLKTKTIRERLGDASQLPSISDVRAEMPVGVYRSGKSAFDLLDVVSRLNQKLRRERTLLVSRQRKERQAFEKSIEARNWKEAARRQARFRPGTKGIWDWMRGETARIKRLNETEALELEKQSRRELDELSWRQCRELQSLQARRNRVAERAARDFRANRRAREFFRGRVR